MTKNQFIYVTYIRTTPQKLWQALTDPEFTKRYWLETRLESTWKPGAPWRGVVPNGKAGVIGEVIEAEPPKRLVFTWRNENDPVRQAEGFSKVTYNLEPQGESVKLTVVHEVDPSAPQTFQSVSKGWPLVLASLKSFVETGEPLEETRHYAVCSSK